MRQCTKLKELSSSSEGRKDVSLFKKKINLLVVEGCANQKNWVWFRFSESRSLLGGITCLGYMYLPPISMDGFVLN